MKVLYNKLVRDKIPEIIIKNGENPIVIVLTDEEMKKELIKKLFEEVNEIKNSIKRVDILEECSDVLSVIFAIAKQYDTSMEDLINLMKEKDNKRGTFNNNFYLKDVT